MAWEQLSINRPHLVYILLGGFTSIFMLVSLFIKEKLYIGEATVATICGVIFGPHAANLINPLDWGNTDQITLEFSRIVLVVQCFAVGVELPKAYMERHWRSVVFLLVPVMAFGWLITSLFIWWLIEPLSWLESLVVAACVTATDPVLASSVVGKGKFAKRVPKHLRDILSAESGCNDGMAFPFIYLGLYLLRYHLDAAHVTFHWMCFTVLYECVFGAFYGFMVGYIARHAIRLAHDKGIVDRESFLVFYFVLALFCAGSGSLLGLDDLLVGFAAGVGFSNDGWFTEKTEESHVSNVIDLLLNLTYFVYFGTIIPWDQFNAPAYGLEPWRLVVIAILVLFFRRIPIMMSLKPIIPDLKTWREALFAGHFGPIGVGAIFVAILARAELETESTTPLAELPPVDDPEYTLIYTIWPIVTFLVIASIIVHGSSIAVFTLGRRINTLTLTYSFTTGNEKSSAWMDRLPRFSSKGRSSSQDLSIDKDYRLPLAQVKDEDVEKGGSRSSSRHAVRRRKNKKYGGPISASAIAPAPRDDTPTLSNQESGSDTLNEKGTPLGERADGLGAEPSGSGDSTPSERRQGKRRSRSPSATRADVEAFVEGGHLIIEDEEGNVLQNVRTNGMSTDEKNGIIETTRHKLEADRSGNFAKHKHKAHRRNEGEEIEHNVEQAVEHPQKGLKDGFLNWKGFGRKSQAQGSEESSQPKKRGPAHAFQFGNTVIIEDEDGEVIKEYKLPPADGQQRRFTYNNDQVRSGLQRMGTWVGLSHKPEKVAAEASGVPEDDLQEVHRQDAREIDRPESPIARPARARRRSSAAAVPPPEQGDDGLRLTVSRADRYGWTGLQKPRPGEKAEDRLILMGSGRRMTQSDFLAEIQQLDARDKTRAVDDVSAHPDTKRELHQEIKKQHEDDGLRPSARRQGSSTVAAHGHSQEDEEGDYFTARQPTRVARLQSDRATPRERPRTHRQDTAETMESVEVPTHDTRSIIARHSTGQTAAALRRQRLSVQHDRLSEGQEEEDEDEEEDEEEQETAAERRRRLAALGRSTEPDTSDSSDDDREPRRAKDTVVREPSESPLPAARRIQWGGETGRQRANTAGKNDKPSTADDKGGDAAAAAGPEQTSASTGVGKKLRGFLKR